MCRLPILHPTRMQPVSEVKKMNKISGRTICALVILYVLMMATFIRPQSRDGEMLNRRIPEFQVTEAPTSLVLQRLANTSGVPIGVEVVPENDGQKRTITVITNGATVQNILDLIIGKDPRYLWQQTDSAINVFPKGAKDPLMETIVERFEVSDVNKEQAIRELENSPEVKKLLAQNFLSERTLRSLPGDSEYNLPRFSLNLTHASVRDILNKIALASNSKNWIFFRYGSRNELFSLSMR